MRVRAQLIIIFVSIGIGDRSLISHFILKEIVNKGKLLTYFYKESFSTIKFLIFFFVISIALEIQERIIFRGLLSRSQDLLVFWYFLRRFLDYPLMFIGKGLLFYS